MRLVAVVSVAWSTGCALCSSDDGLAPRQWEARERSRAAEHLPAARALLIKRGDSTLTSMRPRSVVVEIGSVTDESFQVGGVPGWAGPRYRHSCIAAFDSPSYFNLQREYAWVSPDSLVFGTVSASASAEPHAGPPSRLGARREAASLGSVTEATFERNYDHAFLNFTYSAGKQLWARVLILPPGSDSAAQVFVEYVRGRAGLPVQRGH